MHFFTSAFILSLAVSAQMKQPKDSKDWKNFADTAVTASEPKEAMEGIPDMDGMHDGHMSTTPTEDMTNDQYSEMDMDVLKEYGPLPVGTAAPEMFPTPIMAPEALPTMAPEALPTAAPGEIYTTDADTVEETEPETYTALDSPAMETYPAEVPVLTSVGDVAVSSSFSMLLVSIVAYFTF